MNGLSDHESSLHTDAKRQHLKSKGIKASAGKKSKTSDEAVNEPVKVPKLKNKPRPLVSTTTGGVPARKSKKKVTMTHSS